MDLDKLTEIVYPRAVAYSRALRMPISKALRRQILDPTLQRPPITVGDIEAAVEHLFDPAHPENKVKA